MLTTALTASVLTPRSASIEARRTAPAATKLVHLQILRAVAATLVVVDHTLTSLSSRGISFGHASDLGYFTGTTGVNAFFILSGLIMMRQSAERFGTRDRPAIFLYHRILRIVPMYWIATGLWFASLLKWRVGVPHAAAQMLLSLTFLPDFFSPVNKLKPILQQGWTLNYEMSFYLLFTLALFLRRRYGVGLLLAVPVLLVALGRIFHFPSGGSFLSVLHFYTDPLLLLFAFGVLIGWIEVLSRRSASFRSPVSPAFLLLLPPLVFWLFPAALHHLIWSWLGVQLCCVSVVTLCTLVQVERLGWFSSSLVLLGDASYSTYLFHLWACAWVIPPVAWIYTRLGAPAGSATGFVVVAILAANLLGLTVHLVVERPITLYLRSLKFGFLQAREP